MRHRGGVNCLHSVTFSDAVTPLEAAAFIVSQWLKGRDARDIRDELRARRTIVSLGAVLRTIKHYVSIATENATYRKQKDKNNEP
jgi:hypothetical protein